LDGRSKQIQIHFDLKYNLSLDLPSISFRNFLQAHHGSLNSTALTAAFVFHHVAPQERHL
jgi:hypothetical protein